MHWVLKDLSLFILHSAYTKGIQFNSKRFELVLTHLKVHLFVNNARRECQFENLQRMRKTQTTLAFHILQLSRPQKHDTTNVRLFSALFSIMLFCYSIAEKNVTNFMAILMPRMLFSASLRCTVLFHSISNIIKRLKNIEIQHSDCSSTSPRPSKNCS